MKAIELTRLEVEEINLGMISGMVTYKGKLNRSDMKYILIPSTGSIVVSGSIHKTMEEILKDNNLEWVIKLK